MSDSKDKNINDENQNDNDSEDESSLHTYIGVDNNPEEGCPNICVEFDISLKIFLLALVWSRLSCDDKKDD